ncbi:hypothetical protein K432DRAFT_378294 [Lepidopterella palustris CBS 459.81]|uniref:Copper acquisition factor BIM1-like domain-containing protein n=1 Tax=Lepidopterella palustris CBS 459.81 TaxID=1314670 RepID=A0A8E2EJ08_9PEZI|nr:hypothetical protein K432DRAFT_378294 [Lepidopterella palustris CBS 459.81]
MLSNLVLLALLPLASAHFLLTWPPARGFDDSKSTSFPCGGFDTVLSNRTTWPAVGGPIQLEMHHTQTDVQVLIALGSDPGVNYNIVMRPTFLEQGLGNFCMGMVALPAGVNITEGMPATIQVVSNGDDGDSGGLYQCADVTLTMTALSTSDYNSHCNNGTGVQTSQLSGAAVNANETSPSATGATSGSASVTAATATHSGLATQRTMAAWALGAVGIVGGLVAL